ncbi:telomere-associated protein RIF1-like [Sycon ciliatum]|uniref:telomere-associated protein RIF1-like n=1 Tax=Sycon ciliatum TaxID=27933 RepID=UPI0031F62146
MIGRPGHLQRPPLVEGSSRTNSMQPPSPARTPTTPRLRKASSSYCDVARKVTDSLKSASSEEDRAAVYNVIYEYLRFSDSNSAVSLWQSLPSATLVSLLIDDIMASTNVVALATCNVFNHLVRHAVIAKSFADAAELLVELCRGALRRSDKPLYPICMSCVVHQKIDSVLMESKVRTIVDLWHDLMASPSPSSVMLMEGLNALQRLQTDFPAVLDSKLLHWSHVVYPLLANSTPKVRSKALDVLVGKKEQLKALGGSFLVRFAPDFKKTLNAQLLALMNTGCEVFVLDVWAFVVELLGKALHQGPFINETLKVAQLAFRKQSSPDIQIATFKAWQSLIANFETDPAVLAVPKRLSLILKPLQANLSPVPSPGVDEARARCWWRLVAALGDKVAANFVEVCIPMLGFCLTPQVVPDSDSSGLATSSDSSLHIARCPMLGCQMVASFLNTKMPPHSTPKQIDTLANAALSTEALASALPALANSICSLARCTGDHHCTSPTTGKNGPPTQEIVPASWLQCVMLSYGNHLKSLLPANDDLSRDTVQARTKTLVKVLETLASGLRSMVKLEKPPSLPLRLLLQTMLSLPESTLLTGKCVEALQHCDEQSSTTMVPVILFLADAWFSPAFYTGNLNTERYIILYEMVVRVGMQCMDVLQFVQSIISLLVKRFRDLSAITELPWRLWSVLANRLHRYLVQEQKVAQGSRLAPHFTAVHQTLLFGVNHILQLSITQSTQRDLVKTWVDVYRAFTSAATLNEDIEPNECLQGLCDEMAVDKLSTSGVLPLAQLIDAVVEGADFSASPKVVKNISSSPFKRSPGQQPSVSNLLPLFNLLKRVSDAVYGYLIGQTGGGKTAPGFGSLRSSGSLLTSAPASAAQLMSTLTRVFSQLSTVKQISTLLSLLSPSIALFLSATDSKQGCVKTTFPSGFIAKLEKLWTSLMTCVQSRYNQPFTSELLAAMSPAVASAIDHTNRAVRTRTLVFWNATFATATVLEYPAVLRTTLAQVKKKSPITLPGWLDEQGFGVSEAFTELNTEESASQDMLILRRDVPASPKKTWGSFLSRGSGVSSPVKSPFMKAATVPSPSRSPAQLMSAGKSPATRSVRRRLPLSFDSASAKTSFVRIDPPKEKKKTTAVLTDHQQEMKERKTEIPALYSLLDQSQESTTSKFAAQKRKSSAESPPKKRLFSEVGTPDQARLPFLMDEDTQFDLPFSTCAGVGAASTGSMPVGFATNFGGDGVGVAVHSTPLSDARDKRQAADAMLLVVDDTCEAPEAGGDYVGASTTAGSTGAVATAADEKAKSACETSPQKHSSTGNTTPANETPTIPYHSLTGVIQTPQTAVHAPETPTIRYIPATQPTESQDEPDVPATDANTLAPETQRFVFVDESTQDQRLDLRDQSTAPTSPSAATVGMSPILMMGQMSPIPHRSYPSMAGEDSNSCRSASDAPAAATAAASSLGLSSLFTSTPRKVDSSLFSSGAPEADKTRRDLSSLIEIDESSLPPPAKCSRTPAAETEQAAPPAASAAQSTDGGAMPAPSTPAKPSSALHCQRSTASARLLRSGRRVSASSPPPSATASPRSSARVKKRRRSDDVAQLTQDHHDNVVAMPAAAVAESNATDNHDVSMLLHVTTPDTSMLFLDQESDSMPPPPSTELHTLSSPPPDTNVSCTRGHPNSAVDTNADTSILTATAKSSMDSSAPESVGKRKRGRQRKNPSPASLTALNNSLGSSSAAVAAPNSASDSDSVPPLSTPGKSVPVRPRATRLVSRRRLHSIPVTPITVIPETQSEDMDDATNGSMDAESVAMFHASVAASASPAFRQKQMTTRVNNSAAAASDDVIANDDVVNMAGAVAHGNSALDTPVDTSASIICGNLFADIADSPSPVKTSDAMLIPDSLTESAQETPMDAAGTDCEQAATVPESNQDELPCAIENDTMDAECPIGTAGETMESVIPLVTDLTIKIGGEGDCSPVVAAVLVEQQDNDGCLPIVQQQQQQQQLTPVLNLTPSSQCSPASSSFSSCSALSPSSILKTSTSSRPSHQRRVTFDLPDEVTSSPLDSPRRLRRFGGRPPRRLDMKQSMLRQRGLNVPEAAVYPPLATSVDPVERILPALSSGGRSRGLLQLMKSRNIRTVGDLSCLTPEGIASLPIRAPKVKVLIQALELFHVTRFSPGCTPRRQHVKRTTRRYIASVENSQEEGGNTDGSMAAPKDPLLLPSDDLESIPSSADNSSVLSSEGSDLDASFTPDALVGDCCDTHDTAATADDVMMSLVSMDAPLDAAAHTDEEESNEDVAMDTVHREESEKPQETAIEPLLAAETPANVVDTCDPSSADDDTLIDDCSPGGEQMDSDEPATEQDVQADTDGLSTGQESLASDPTTDTPTTGSEWVEATKQEPAITGDLNNDDDDDDDETQDPGAPTADVEPAASKPVVTTTLDSGNSVPASSVSTMSQELSEEPTQPYSSSLNEPANRTSSNITMMLCSNAPVAHPAAAPSPQAVSEPSKDSQPESVPVESKVAEATAETQDLFDCDISDELDTSTALEEIDSLIAMSSQCSAAEMEMSCSEEQNGTDAAVIGGSADDVAAGVHGEHAMEVHADGDGDGSSTQCFDSQFDVTGSASSSVSVHRQPQQLVDYLSAAPASKTADSSAATSQVCTDSQLPAGQGHTSSNGAAPPNTSQSQRSQLSVRPASPMSSSTSSGSSVYQDVPESHSAPEDVDDGDDGAGREDVRDASFSSINSLPRSSEAWQQATDLFSTLTTDELESWSPRHLCNLQVQLSQLMARVAYATRSTAAAAAASAAADCKRKKP